MKRTAIYAGTFDPFTKGHMELVQRSLEIFDCIHIVVAVPFIKQPFLTAEERVQVIREVFKGEQRIVVNSWDGLLVNYALEHDIKTIIRGLRPTGDFDAEFQMYAMNKILSPDIDVVFFMASNEYHALSSSAVREIFIHNGDVSSFVPASVFSLMQTKIKR